MLCPSKHVQENIGQDAHFFYAENANGHLDNDYNSVSHEDTDQGDTTKNKLLLQISSLQSQLEQHEKTRANLQQKFREQEESIEIYRKQISRNQAIEEERTLITNKLQELEQATKSLKEQLERHRAVEEDLVLDKNNYKEQIFEIGKKLNDISDESRKLKTLNSSRSDVDLNSLLQQLQNEIALKQQSNLEVEEQLNKLELLNEQLKQQTEKSSLALDETLEKISKLEDEQKGRVLDTKKSSGNLLDELSSMKKGNVMSPIKSLQDELSLLNSKGEEVEDISQLLADRDAYLSKIDELLEEKDQLNKRIEALSIDCSEDAIQRLIEELTALKDKLASLERENEDLKLSMNDKGSDDSDNIRKEINSVLESIAMIYKEIETLHTRLSEFDTSSHTLEEQKDVFKDLQDDIDRMKSESQVYDNQIKFVESQKNQLETLIRSKDLIISKMRQASGEKPDLDESSLESKSVGELRRELNLMKLKVEEDVHVLKSLKQELNSLKDNRNRSINLKQEYIPSGEDENESLLTRKKVRRSTPDTCCACTTM